MGSRPEITKHLLEFAYGHDDDVVCITEVYDRPFPVNALRSMTRDSTVKVKLKSLWATFCCIHLDNAVVSLLVLVGAAPYSCQKVVDSS